MRIAVEGVSQRGKPAWLGRDIVVEEGHVAAAGRLRAGIVPGSKASVAVERDDAHSRKRLSDEVDRSIAGSVVDHDQFTVRRNFGHRRGEAALEPGAPVVVQDDDGSGERGVVHLPELEAVTRASGVGPAKPST